MFVVATLLRCNLANFTPKHFGGCGYFIFWLGGYCMRVVGITFRILLRHVHVIEQLCQILNLDAFERAHRILDILR
jgi:hypothetical protein